LCSVSPSRFIFQYLASNTNCEASNLQFLWLSYSKSSADLVTMKVPCLGYVTYVAQTMKNSVG